MFVQGENQKKKHKTVHSWSTTARGTQRGQKTQSRRSRTVQKRKKKRGEETAQREGTEKATYIKKNAQSRNNTTERREAGRRTALHTHVKYLGGRDAHGVLVRQGTQKLRRGREVGTPAAGSIAPDARVPSARAVAAAGAAAAAEAARTAADAAALLRDVPCARRRISRKTEVGRKHARLTLSQRDLRPRTRQREAMDTHSSGRQERWDEMNTTREGGSERPRWRPREILPHPVRQGYIYTKTLLFPSQYNTARTREGHQSFPHLFPALSLLHPSPCQRPRRRSASREHSPRILAARRASRKAPRRDSSPPGPAASSFCVAPAALPALPPRLPLLLLRHRRPPQAAACPGGQESGAGATASIRGASGSPSAAGLST